MSEALQRGLLLLGQNRNDLAAEQFIKHLSAEPNDAHAHSLLAMCLADSQRFKDATHHAEEAVRLAPDFPFAHYALSYVLAERNHMKEALGSINEAIRLDPYDADYFALLARIHLTESRHQPALNAAEQGLEIDAENVACQNLRAMALKNLGRHSDAAQALDGALARDPENAITHANKGWALLEKGQSDAALKHFQEALRIDPTLDWAREGIVTALKSRYKIYAVMLKYFLWMGKLTSQQQWMVILGVYFGSKMLAQAAKTNPGLAPYIMPVRMLLMAFVVLTWIADPLFNLALRFNPYGRLALSDEQRKGSNLVVLFLGMSVASLLAGLIVGPLEKFALVALGTGLMVMPLSAIYKCPEGWPRRMMAGYSAILATALFAGIILLWSVYDLPARQAGARGDAAMICGGIYLVGILASGWIANILLTWRVRR